MVTESVLTKPTYRGAIRFPDGDQPPVLNGVVMVSGVSPNAKVTLMNIFVDDGETPGRRKRRRQVRQQVDFLTSAEIDAKRNKLIITGNSVHARNVMHLPPGEDRITVEVDLTGNCEDCK